MEVLRVEFLILCLVPITIELDFEGFTANLLDFNYVIISLTNFCIHDSTIFKDLAEWKSVISSVYIIQVPIYEL